MFIYALAIVQPGCAYKICFYKKGVYPTSYGKQMSLPQTIFVIILFFKMQCREHCFIKTCVKHSCQLAFTENFKKQVVRVVLEKKLFWKKLCGSIIFLQKVCLQLTANNSTEIVLLRMVFLLILANIQNRYLVEHLHVFNSDLHFLHLCIPSDGKCNNYSSSINFVHRHEERERERQSKIRCRYKNRIIHYRTRYDTSYIIYNMTVSKRQGTKSYTGALSRIFRIIQFIKIRRLKLGKI